jgi:hypothetical protein
MTKKFTHEGKEYEIRAAAFEDGYKAAVFHQEKKLSETAKLSFETDMDIAHFTGEHGMDFLVRALEEHVKSGRLRA